MRLWSLNPCYLDSKGLVACWREGLLAQKVLMGETKGYKNHPQLKRFKKLSHPIHAISQYLWFIYEEAIERGYKFDNKKIKETYPVHELTVTKKQLEYEFEHLQGKLYKRDTAVFMTNKDRIDSNNIEPHPLFKVIEGEIESWENYEK